MPASVDSRFTGRSWHESLGRPLFVGALLHKVGDGDGGGLRSTIIYHRRSSQGGAEDSNSLPQDVQKYICNKKLRKFLYFSTQNLAREAYSGHLIIIIILLFI